MSSITVNLDNLSEEERAQIMSIAEKANAPKEVRFPGVKDGETFKIGDMEFIKFPNMGGVTPVVAKDFVFVSQFGDNNNLAESDVLKKLEAETLSESASSEYLKASAARADAEQYAINELKKYGFDTDYVEHGLGVYPQNAAGVPFTAAYLQSKGDAVTDLIEDLAAEGATTKEQPTYSNAPKPLI